MQTMPSNGWKLEQGQQSPASLHFLADTTVFEQNPLSSLDLCFSTHEASLHPPHSDTLRPLGFVANISKVIEIFHTSTLNIHCMLALALALSLSLIYLFCGIQF